MIEMLKHAYEDAQVTGHCHWCEMKPIIEEHVVVGYTHADDCELERIADV